MEPIVKRKELDPTNNNNERNRTANNIRLEGETMDGGMNQIYK